MTTFTIPTETVTETTTLITSVTTSILTTAFQTITHTRRDNQTVTTTITTGTTGGIDTLGETLQIIGFIFGIGLTVLVEALVLNCRTKKQKKEAYDSGFSQGVSARVRDRPAAKIVNEDDTTLINA
jgi:hypothetical protein